MPIRKLPEEITDTCLNPEHNPPTHMYLEGGRYEYTCPSCGQKTVFSVPTITS